MARLVMISRTNEPLLYDVFGSECARQNVSQPENCEGNMKAQFLSPVIY
jgi:hypothetical protein